MTAPAHYIENLPSPYAVQVYRTEQNAIDMAHAVNLITGLRLCKPCPHAHGWILNPVPATASR